MNDVSATIQELKVLVKKFIDEREWGQYHNVKNLSMGLATEAAELMEIFRWYDYKESDEIVKSRPEEVRHEIADVLFMLLALSSKYDIDLAQAMKEKLVVSSHRYPVEKCRGKREKYTHYFAEKS